MDLLHVGPLSSSSKDCYSNDYLVYSEGAFTVVLGAVFLFLLPKTVATCKYLSAEQKEVVYKALECEGQRQETDVS